MKKHLFLLITVMLFSTVIVFAQEETMEQPFRNINSTISDNGGITNYYQKQPLWQEYQEPFHTNVDEQIDFEVTSFINWENQLQTEKKIKIGQDWWEVDTIAQFLCYDNNSVGDRAIYSYNLQGFFLTCLGQVLQNDIWVDKAYITYTYDSNNNMLTCLQQYWRNGILENYEKYTRTYDSNNNILTDLHQKWQNGWIDNFKSIYTYDSNNNRLISLYQTCQNDIWKNSLQITRTYDSNNNELTYLNQGWQNDILVNRLKYTYTYDSNNNRLTFLGQGWQDNTWVNTWEYTYTYDSNNNRLTYLEQTGQGINEWLQTYTYDSNNNMQTLLWQKWQNGIWIDQTISTFTYDSNKNLLTKLEDGAYYPPRKYVWVYDENDNCTSVEVFTWINKNWQYYESDNLKVYYNNMQSLIYGNGHKVITSYMKVGTGKTYNFSASGGSINIPVNYNEPWTVSSNAKWLTTSPSGENDSFTMTASINTSPSSRKTTVTVSSGRTIIRKIDVTQDGTVSIIEKAETTTFKIYPNPTIGKLKIVSGELKIEEIEIFDIYGRMQMTKSRVPKTEGEEILIDISELPVGIYFLRITSELGKVTRKVVKE